MPDVALEATGLSKTFGNTRVLRDVSFTLGAGEVHGLLGQNGSGKSTLIKILAGFHTPDPGGALSVYGSSVSLPVTSRVLRANGVGFVHQDLGLVSGLSILDNFMALEWGGRAHGLSRVAWRDARQRAQAAVQRVGLHVDVRESVDVLDRAHRALLALARALAELSDSSHRREILVLDEITAFLARAESEVLYRAVRAIAGHGGTVLMVSHDIDEVLELCDTLTILRDGAVVDRVQTAGTTPERLVESITGVVEDPDRQRSGRPAGADETGPVDEADAAVRVTGLTGKRVRQLDLTVRPGEIVGVTGLRGSGYEEIPYLMFGVLPFGSGSVRYGSSDFSSRGLSPKRAVAAGVGLVPANRLDLGCAAGLTVAENASLQVVRQFVKATMIRGAALRKSSAEVLKRHLVRPPLPEVKLGTLSGGNQQKVLLAKWMWAQPKVLLLHQPTQGVDVGARRDILQMLRIESSRGLAVLCADEDSELLAELCDRVLVFADGRCRAELSGVDLTKERLDSECIGQRPNGGDVS